MFLRNVCWLSTDYAALYTLHKEGCENLKSNTLLFRSIVFILFFYILWGGTKSLGTAATFGLLYNTSPRCQMPDEGDCGAISNGNILI
jgi:hypothetical protein